MVYGGEALCSEPQKSIGKECSAMCREVLLLKSFPEQHHRRSTLDSRKHVWKGKGERQANFCLILYSQNYKIPFWNLRERVPYTFSTLINLLTNQSHLSNTYWNYVFSLQINLSDFTQLSLLLSCSLLCISPTHSLPNPSIFSGILTVSCFPSFAMKHTLYLVSSSNNL